MKKIVLLFIIVMMPAVAWAHPGKTDSIGGHKCIKGCENWGLFYGEYHLHDKDGKPIRVARKTRVIREPSASGGLDEKKAITAMSPSQEALNAAPTPLSVHDEEAGIAVSPLILLLLALLLFLLLIKQRQQRYKT